MANRELTRAMRRTPLTLKGSPRHWAAFQKALTTEHAQSLEFYSRFGERGIDSVLRHGVPARELIEKYGKKAALAISNHGRDALIAITEHGKPAIDAINRHGLRALDAMDRAKQSGEPIATALKRLMRK